MKTTLVTMAAVAGLSACAYVQETYAPSGAKAYTIDCSGGAMSWAACYEAAGNRCGAAGYTVLQQNEGATANSAIVGGIFSANRSQSRALLVECKRPQ